MFPTVLELVGAGPGPSADGVSFAATLLGQGEQERHAYLYWEYAGRQAVRMSDWKALRLGLREGDTSIQLYDLGDDPYETTDVGADHPEVVAQMAAILGTAHAPSEAFPLPTVDAR